MLFTVRNKSMVQGSGRLTCAAAACLVAVVPLVCAGCGSSGYPTAKVTGRITFEGRPIAGGGSVRFVPITEKDDSRPGKPASGLLAPDGTFTLSTYEEGDGAIVSEHRVEVSQLIYLEQPVYDYEEPTAADDAGQLGEARLVRPGKTVDPSQQIPAIYSGPESPLRVTVAKGDNEITLDLKRNP